MEVKKTLKEVREAKGFSQKEVADVLGITQAHLSYIETNDRTPSLKLAKKIADFYDEPIENFF